MAKGVKAFILGRLAFCTMECFHAALEVQEGVAPIRQRVLLPIAATIQCYGCGQYLDE